MGRIKVFLFYSNCDQQRRSGKCREEPRAAEPPPSLSSSFSRGASSHVGASLFRYQDRIVRIDCIRTQLLVSLPRFPCDTQPRTGKKPPVCRLWILQLDDPAFRRPVTEVKKKNNSRCTDRTDWYIATLQCSSGERPYSNNAPERRAPVISVDSFSLEFSESPC